jgi:serine/threonine protein phosphatase PrpC
LHVQAAGRSLRGRATTQNQDAFAVEPRLGLFAIADGVGGRPAGGLASARSLAVVRDALVRATQGPPCARLRAAVEEANLRILVDAERDAAMLGMATTFTGALVCAERTVVAHVGDSAAYLLHDRRLDRLTEMHILQHDPTWGVLDLEARAMLTDQRRSLTRSLGAADTVLVDVGAVEPHAGDALLLCSDGLLGAVAEKEIAGILIEHPDPSAAVERLIARARERDAQDDATAIVVRWAAEGGR